MSIKSVTQSSSLESQSKSQFITQSTSDYHFVSNNSGNQTITAKISHCRTQSTADHCGKYTYKYNKQFEQQSNQLHTMQTHQITPDLFTIPAHRLKFAPLKCNFTPLLVPNVRFNSSLKGYLFEISIFYQDRNALLKFKKT